MRGAICFLLGLVLASLPLLPRAQDGTSGPASVEVADIAASASPAPMVLQSEAEDAAFGAYVDGMVDAVLAREHLAGMVVSVVRDDRVLLARGYGLANVETARAADPERSLFRIGSISKTFAYVATMQLVADARLGLDDPVNDHLPPALALPDDGFAEPVRIRHLLTHTAGYEDSALGHLFVRDAAAVLTPEEYLVRHRPRRVRAPGSLAVYSNYSIAVLGAVIAHASGLSFTDYVEQRLTGPLGMARATFREPLPAGDPRALDPALTGELATGYRRTDGAFVAGPFEFISHGAAAGAMSASAGDMARWMRMLLAAGQLDGVRVLPETTALAMRETLFSNADGAPGIAHGFLSQQLGPYLSIGHGGATLYFHSGMLLVPERRIGVFVSCNTASSRAAVAEVARMIIERLLPDARVAATVQAQDAAALARYAGTYRSNRRAYSTIEKLFLGLGNDAEVRIASDGSLRVSGGGDVTRWLPIGAGRFRDADSPALMLFLDGPDGRPDRYVFGHGISVYERVGVLDTAGLLLAALTLAGLLSLARLAHTLRRKPRRPAQDPRPGLAAVKTLSIVSALAWLAFLGAAVVASVGMLSEGNEVVFTYPSAMLRLTLWLAVLMAIVTTLELVALVPVWRGDWRLWPRLRYTLVVATLAFGVALLCRWQVVGSGW